MSHRDLELATGLLVPQGCRFRLCACFSLFFFLSLFFLFLFLVFVFEKKKRNANFKAFNTISELLCGPAMLK